MGLTDQAWAEIQSRLDPRAWADLAEHCAETDIDPGDQLSQVLSKAIDLHHAYTGVTLTFHF